MKQEIISHLATIKEDLFNLSKFLYNNPEKSFCEYTSSDYIVKLLKTHNFEVQENYLNIPTAFYAQYGCGHPKICYICKYAACESLGHIYGNNANATISIGAALGLSKVIAKTHCSIIVLGCPGEYYNGAEMTMTKEKAFEDIDIIFAPHVDISNAESGTSLATIPLKVEFCCDNNEKSNYTALDVCTLVFDILSKTSKFLNNDSYIDNVSLESSKNNHFSPYNATMKFCIKAHTIKDAEILEKKFRDLIKLLSTILNINSDISLFELPCIELKTNKTLSRLFAHNLKQSGIINMDCCKNASYGLGIGSISHTTPCIYPSICIITKEHISCPSLDFGKLTLTDYSQEKMIQAIEALAITSLDLIEKEELLKEVTCELYNN